MPEKYLCSLNLSIYFMATLLPIFLFHWANSLSLSTVSTVLRLIVFHLLFVFVFLLLSCVKKETQDKVYFLHFSLTSKLKSTKLFNLFSFKELHTLLFFCTLVLFCFALSASLFYTISIHLTSTF